MKIAIKITLIIGILGYLVFAITTMSRDKEERKCSGIEIIIEDTVSTNYVTTAFIDDIIAKTKTPIENTSITDIDVNLIENSILQSPYIDSVICYYTPENLMCIRIFPRIPILHVLSNSGESYYMDSNGNDMPTDIFLLDLCFITGNLSKQYAKENLIELATFLNSHPIWSKEIQQVHVESDKNIELIPTTGEHTIILGEPTDIEKKMDKLAIFYKEGLDKVGWNKYRIINLSYANQVVCTKKDKK